MITRCTKYPRGSSPLLPLLRRLAGERLPLLRSSPGAALLGGRQNTETIPSVGAASVSVMDMRFAPAQTHWLASLGGILDKERVEIEIGAIILEYGNGKG